MPHVYRAVVKGNTTQAIYAAQSRGFAILSIVQNGKPDGSGNTILSIEHANYIPIGNWLAEGPRQPPFPPGTLLFYKDDDSGEERKRVWIAAHGYPMADDLEGLSAVGDLALDYKIGDLHYKAFENGVRRFNVQIYRKRLGKYDLISSDIAYDDTPEMAMLTAVSRAASYGDVTSAELERLRDRVREQRPKTGFPMDDDLEGVESDPDATHYLLGNVILGIHQTGQRNTFIGSVTINNRGVFEDTVVAPTKEDAARHLVQAGIRRGFLTPLHLNALQSAIREEKPGVRRGRETQPLEDDLEGFGEFHRWSVSTLVPGLHGKPKYMYFDEFRGALDYARERARKGKKVREGGRAYFILDMSVGSATHRVIRANLGAEQRGGQQYVEKREFVLVQENQGPIPGQPDKTRWVTDKKLSVEILDSETEKTRKSMPPRIPRQRGDAEDRAAYRLAALKAQGVNAKIVVRGNGSIAIRLPDGSTEEV